MRSVPFERFDQPRIERIDRLLAQAFGRRPDGGNAGHDGRLTGLVAKQVSASPPIAQRQPVLLQNAVGLRDAVQPFVATSAPAAGGRAHGHVSPVPLAKENAAQSAHGYAATVELSA